MDDMDTIKGPEALQMSIRINCICEADINWMQIISANAGGGSFNNMVSASCFECPKCHHRVAVEMVVQSRYDRPPT